MHRSTLDTLPEYALGATRVRILVPAHATRNAYEILEFRGQPGGPGPRPHLHKLADEAFIILEGALEMQLGPALTPTLAPAGTTLHIPRGTPHAFRYAAPDTRFLAVLTPATRFDQYLPKVQALLAAANGGPPDPAALAQAMAEHDAFAP